MQDDGAAKFRYIRDHALATVDQMQLTDFADALDKLMAGFALLLIDGSRDVLAFGVQGFSFRVFQNRKTRRHSVAPRRGLSNPLQINV